MKENNITGQDFYQLFKSGVNEVSKHKDLLNKINVFPVADGDTGTNLQFTLQSAVDYATISNSVTETLMSISQNAINYARGNSGIIFSEFIHGLAIYSHKQEMSVNDFIKTVSSSSKRLYEIVNNPAEGTILTVIRKWANFLESNQLNSFAELFEVSLPIIKKSVDETTNELKDLKKHKVPDSGALGFYLFIEGIKNSMYDTKNSAVDEWKKYEDIEILEEEFDGVYRYCTQFFIKNINGDIKKLIDELESDGNSIVYSGDRDFLNLHLHTNTPWLVSKVLAQYGHIVNSKVDDMWIQNNYRKTKGKIGIVTDSVADISKEILDSHEIHMISMNLLVDMNTYLDKKTIVLDDFLSLIDKSVQFPVSSQPNDQQIRYELIHYLDFHEKLIILSVSSKLSGTYQGFKRFLDKHPEFNEKVYLIDSFLNSGAQGLLVKQAAEICKRDLPIETIVGLIEQEKEKIKTFVVLNTFENLSRSGRINAKIASLANRLRMKAILTLDKAGNGKAYGFSLSSKSVENKVVKKVKELINDKGIQEYVLFYSSDNEGYRNFKKKMETIIGKDATYCVEISSATALHVGKNSFAIALRER